ncbi:MAG: hypothetical protein NT027_12835 [Proteobacteria bacterium]|nr:hypothetical protein [Pseudomonadota bacterium]
MASNELHSISRQLLAAPQVTQDQVKVSPFSGYTRVDVKGGNMDLRVFSVSKNSKSRSSLEQDRVIYNRTLPNP